LYHLQGTCFGAYFKLGAMNTVWGLAVAELVLAGIALGTVATSILTPPTNVTRHSVLKRVAVTVGVLSVLGLLGIALFHQLLVGFEDFLFAIFPGLLSGVSCAVVVWRSRQSYAYQARA
jgi:hypothetical protein